MESTARTPQPQTMMLFPLYNQINFQSPFGSNDGKNPTENPSSSLLISLPISSSVLPTTVPSAIVTSSFSILIFSSSQPSESVNPFPSFSDSGSPKTSTLTFSSPSATLPLHSITATEAPFATETGTASSYPTRTDYSPYPCHQYSLNCVFPECFSGNQIPRQRWDQSAFGLGINRFKFKFFTGRWKLGLHFIVYGRRRIQFIIVKLNQDGNQSVNGWETGKQLKKFGRRKVVFRIPYSQIWFLKQSIRNTCCNKKISVFVKIRICERSGRGPMCRNYENKIYSISLTCRSL